MTKKDILNELKILDDIGLDRKSYSIVYGGALVMRGVKDSSRDIDITINRDAYSYLLEKGMSSTITSEERLHVSCA